MITPSQRFYRAAPGSPRKVATGIDRLSDRLSGFFKRSGNPVGKLGREADRALRLHREEIASLDEAEFEEVLRDLHRRFRRGESSPRLLRRALAGLARASEEILGLTPYREQLMGALAIHKGWFAEMATGEGKTLTIGLAAILAGWKGQPVHIITANDYLAQRDAESLEDLYRFCGIEVGHVIGEMPGEERPAQYVRAVVYTTSQELLADFLRDRLKLGSDQSPQARLIRQMHGSGSNKGSLCLRGIHTVIVDEADSILIDEAVTPLIISQRMSGQSFNECCTIARDLSAHLKPGVDYEIDFKHGEINLQKPGIAAIARHSHRLPAIWRSHDRRGELVKQALVASHFFERDKHYVISEEAKVEIVDEFTGRILPGRTWKQGLHQAIEAKEGITVTDPTETLASMSFQRFFRMFRSISGVSGTARESSSELWRMYRLPVVCIPTHRPVRRTYEKVRVHADLEEKHRAIVDEIAELHEAGRPVLVGTRTVEASEALSAELRKRSLPHDVLNAVRHAEEARIVSQAGQPGRISIATNMAGRGTDIRLTEEVIEEGGLHVIVAEHNLSPRIDRQLVGRSARQGEPGSARFHISPEDELLVRFLHPRRRKRLLRTLGGGAIGANRSAISAIRRAQRTAERLSEKQREAVLKMDTWLEEHLAFSRKSSR